MAKRKSNQRDSFNYNEPKRTPPDHKYPKSQRFSTYKNPGISSRIIIERALKSPEGVNIESLKQIGATARDLIKYRKQIKNALYGLIKEDSGADLRLRSGAIGYLSALGYTETTDLLGAIALNNEERDSVRGYAIEALARLNGENAPLVLEELLNDPIDIVREKSIRGLGKIGGKEQTLALQKLTETDIDPEVVYRSKEALNQIITGVIPSASRNKTKERNSTRPMRNIIKPIGRHSGVQPQTTPHHNGDGKATTLGNNIVANREIAKNEAEKTAYPISYERISNASKDTVRLKIRGNNIGKAIQNHPDAKIFKVNEDELVLEFPKRYFEQGKRIPLNVDKDANKYQDIHWIPDAPDNPVIYEIGSREDVIWAKEKFGIYIRFNMPKNVKSASLILRTRLPKSNWMETYVELSEKDLANGEMFIDGFLSAITGNIKVEANIYTDQGSASKLKTTLMALPSNPISMNVSPTTAGTIGEGPAHYNSSENRFYCYANLEISNGFPHTVTLGPTVSIRVTDGGSETDNFSGSIGASTIAGNSTRTIGIWMSFGGGTYNVFKDYGDVTIRITLQTSEGDIVDSHVWAAMGQVKLALNFVGNFTGTTRNQLQTSVDIDASGIYEQQNLYISDSAQFVIPSTHSDFNRYRDIEMDDNKDSDCTAGSDEADDLRDDWSSPNDSWLDVWLVETLSGPACAASVGGFSPVDGPTSKGGSRSGVIVKMSSADLSTAGGRNLMGIIIAHEVGHFLGLNHTSTNDNFMEASVGGSNTDITHGQYLTMAEHGFVTRFVV